MRRTTVFVICLLIIIAPQAPAETYTWTGGDSDWTNPLNWNPVGVPGAGDVAVIGPGGIPPIIDVNLGRVGAIKVDDKLFVRTGGDVYIDPEAGPGDLLVGSATNKPGRLVMSGGRICGFEQHQIGKRTEGVLDMADDDVNDPGGSPLLWSCGDGFLKLGGKDGGSGDAKVYLDNGTIHVAGLHFYRDEATMDIAGGTLEAGPNRLEYVEGYYRDMKEYVQDLYYDKGWLTCYGGEGELDYTENSPSPEWITVWCNPRDPTRPLSRVRREERQPARTTTSVPNRQVQPQGWYLAGTRAPRPTATTCISAPTKAQSMPAPAVRLWAQLT